MMMKSMILFVPLAFGAKTVDNSPVSADALQPDAPELEADATADSTAAAPMPDLENPVEIGDNTTATGGNARLAADHEPDTQMKVNADGSIEYTNSRTAGADLAANAESLQQQEEVTIGSRVAAADIGDTAADSESESGLLTITSKVTGSNGEGEACATPNECATGLLCDGDPQVCRLPRMGEKCRQENGCDSGAACDVNKNKCHAAEGAQCSKDGNANMKCATGLKCSSEESTGVCQLPGTDDECIEAFGCKKNKGECIGGKCKLEDAS